MMKFVLCLPFMLLALSPVAAFTGVSVVAPVRSPACTAVPSLGLPCRQQQQQHHHHSSSSTPSLVQLSMGWGPDPVWESATLSAISEACPTKKSVQATLTVPPTTGAEYTIPGQYVQVRLDDTMEKPAILAICSPPSGGDDDQENNADSTFDFLIKRNDFVEWLTTLEAGTSVQVSQVMGSGYPIAQKLDSLTEYDFPTQNILLCAAGSGIAPIAAAIESGRLGLGSDGGGRTCRLYYGERSSGDLCFVEDFSRWESMGVQVVPVLSQPDDDWQGRTGYIQTALEEDGVQIPRNSGALVCGMKGMADAVKELLVKEGVFEGRVLFNF